MRPMPEPLNEIEVLKCQHILKRAYELSLSLRTSSADSTTPEPPAEFTEALAEGLARTCVRPVVSNSCRQYLMQLIEADPTVEDAADKEWLYKLLLDELFGFGPLGAIMRDPIVRELRVIRLNLIMVDCSRNAWKRASHIFQSEEHLLDTVSRILKIELPALKNRSYIEKQLDGEIWAAFNLNIAENIDDSKFVGRSVPHIAGEHNVPFLVLQRMAEAMGA